jgi:hypothetical protein
MKRRSAVTFTLLPLWSLLILLACTLTPQPEPPTIVPRASATPPPTIGYATLSPDQYPQQATQIAPVPVQPNNNLLNLMNQVDADRMFVTIDALVSMESRRVGSTLTGAGQGIGAAETYLINEFNRVRDQSYQSTFSVITQDFNFSVDGTSGTGRNIIGILQGTEIGAGVIVLGAHYDSISYNFTDSAAYAPGANDNASGVAALLEIARIMSQRSHRATIMFVAFSAEEIQRKGSIAFIEGVLRANGANTDVKAMLNMDIIGSSTGPDGDINDREIRLYSMGDNNSRSRQLARALNLITVREVSEMKIVVQDAEDRVNRYSDHLSFSEAGYPAVRFIEALEDSSRQHSDRDTIDDIQATYLVRATKTILACMTSLADGPPKPDNVVLRDNGNGTRTLVWDRVPGAVSYIVALRAPDGLIFRDYFETADTLVTWDGFYASRYIALAIAAVDENGLMGPMSFEYGIAS